MWAAIGLMAGVGFALLFFILSTNNPDPSSQNQELPLVKLPSDNKINSLPPVVSLPDPQKLSDASPVEKDSVYSSLPPTGLLRKVEKVKSFVRDHKKVRTQPIVKKRFPPRRRIRHVRRKRRKSRYKRVRFVRKFRHVIRRRPPRHRDRKRIVHRRLSSYRGGKGRKPSQRRIVRRRTPSRSGYHRKRQRPIFSYVSLTIRSKPSRSEVWIDSVLRGKSPLMIRIQKGSTIKVRLKKEGFLSSTFVWKAKKSTKRYITLAENIFH